MTDATIQPFLFGAYPGGNLAGLETMIGRKLGVHRQYAKFEEFPDAVAMADDLRQGRVPMVMWSSNLAGGGSASARAILAGVYDAHIATQASNVSSLDGRVLLEWQPEMTDNPRNALFFENVPPTEWGATYVKVWQHLQSIFESVGADAIEWVWSPGESAYMPHHQSGHVPCEAYFPGPDAIDWMGHHCYTPTLPADYGTDPRIAAFYAAAQKWAPNLPLITSENGASSASAAQADWIKSAQAALKGPLRLIRGFVYFNQDMPTAPWALSGTGLDAYKTMGADPYFTGT